MPKVVLYSKDGFAKEMESSDCPPIIYLAKMAGPAFSYEPGDGSFDINKQVAFEKQVFRKVYVAKNSDTTYYLEEGADPLSIPGLEYAKKKDQQDSYMHMWKYKEEKNQYEESLRQLKEQPQKNWYHEQFRKPYEPAYEPDLQFPTKTEIEKPKPKQVAPPPPPPKIEPEPAIVGERKQRLIEINKSEEGQ